MLECWLDGCFFLNLPVRSACLSHDLKPESRNHLKYYHVQKTTISIWSENFQDFRMLTNIVSGSDKLEVFRVVTVPLAVRCDGPYLASPENHQYVGVDAGLDLLRSEKSPESLRLNA